jgi:serine/threonine-protein kinase HipA
VSARVFVGEVLVGVLRPDVDRQETVFEIDAGYAEQGGRPVLSRWLEDHELTPGRRFAGSPLPSFFRNLLPEGALRKLVEARLGPSQLPEYSMLLRLGENLPGAVRVVGDDADPGPLADAEREARRPGDPYRFALTGVQPKLALDEHDGRLTVPLEGHGGHWVAKFGASGWRELPRNELAMLTWARRCGLVVPDHELVRAEKIEDLPDGFAPNEEVLLVRRFDRVEAGRRVHQEDFAQVFNVAPEERHPTDAPELGWAHYGSIGAVIHALCGFDDFLEYIRRLVFMVLSGNHDAHLKNWALVYPDGLHAGLAPAYDLVATVAYQGLGPHPAMRWSEPAAPTIGPEKPLEDTTLDDLLLAASYTDADTSVVMAEITRFASVIRDDWPRVATEAPAFVRSRVDAHMQRCRLR